MKTCSYQGCSRPVFAMQLCKYHQYRRYMRGGDLYKSKPRKSSAIPKESAKRKEEKKTYIQSCKDLEIEIREQNDGKIYCFFSGEEINERISWHHLKKRTGKFYLDKEWIVPSINKNHVDKYHFAKVKDLIEEPWYHDFMKRLKDRDIHLYYQEIKRQEKGGVFDGEDLDFN